MPLSQGDPTQLVYGPDLDQVASDRRTIWTHLDKQQLADR